MTDVATLHDIERQVPWTAMWTIHNANALREKEDGDVKVGGHQASSASMASILTALCFHALQPKDRAAVKPHAAPGLHAIQYLAGQQTQARQEAFRGCGGAQGCPSRTTDVDGVDFSTDSVGLGVAITAFASLIQDCVAAKSWSDRPKSPMVALIGDAVTGEDDILECLLTGWKRDIRDCLWIIDCSRQPLDGIVHEGLWARIEAIFASFGWNIVRLKHGAPRRATQEEPGGDRLRDWIDNCPNADFPALTFQDCEAWRARPVDDIGDQGKVTALLDRRGNEELSALMTDLGGHCLESLAEAFGSIDDHRPTLFLADTVKGWGTPLFGISQEGLASFKSACTDAHARIMEWSFDYLQRDGEGAPDEPTWLRDEADGSACLRLSTRPIGQAHRSPDAESDQGVIDGAYWLRRPGPNPNVIPVLEGAVAPDVVEAAGRIGQDRHDTGVLAITSAGRLDAGRTAAKRARLRSRKRARAWIERMLAPVPRDCTIVTAIDGHPLTPGLLGAVVGHRTVPLGVEHLGRTGRVSDFRRHCGIDADGIVAAVDEMTAGRSVRLVG